MYHSLIALRQIGVKQLLCSVEGNSNIVYSTATAARGMAFPLISYLREDSHEKFHDKSGSH